MAGTAYAGLTMRPGGLRLAVRLTPKAGRDAVDGWGVDAKGERALCVRVRPAPENGAANDALVALIAGALLVPKSRVSIVKGAHARTKILEVVGDAALLTQRLEGFGDAA